MTRISRVNLLRSPLTLLVTAAVLVAGGAGIAVGASSAHPKAVKVCVTKKGVARAASPKGKCPKKTHKVAVAAKGPIGAKGAPGAAGPVGPQGEPGPGAVGFEQTLTPGDQTHTYQVPGTDISVFCRSVGPKLQLSYVSDGGSYVGTYTEDGVVGTAEQVVDSASGMDDPGSLHGNGEISLDVVYTPISTPAELSEQRVVLVWKPQSQECEVFGEITPAS